LVFALFALWPQGEPSAALLLVAWALAMIGLATFALLRVVRRGERVNLKELNRAILLKAQQLSYMLGLS
jgi:hypothetical protein